MCKYVLRGSNRKLSKAHRVCLPSCHLSGVWGKLAQIPCSIGRKWMNQFRVHWAFSLPCRDTGTLAVAAGAGSGGWIWSRAKGYCNQFLPRFPLPDTAPGRPPFTSMPPSVNLRTACQINLCNLETKCSHQTSPQTFWIGVQEAVSESLQVTLIFRQCQEQLTWPMSFCFQ